MQSSTASTDRQIWRMNPMRDDECVGASGIRRRKKRRQLPEPQALPPGDEDRLFGRFSWGTYSPAGTLERNGLFWRQLRRYRRRDQWKTFGYVLWAMIAVPILLGLIWFVTGLFR
jgi:hypothetical protein